MKIVERLTDPDVDYTKVSKTPVYFEFIDLGEALNKLKEYENLEGKKDKIDRLNNEKYIIHWDRTAYCIKPIYITQREYRGNSLISISYLDSNGLLKSAKLGELCMFDSFQEALARIRFIKGDIEGDIE